MNRVALVTGGSRGIGAAIVRRLAEGGHTIAFTYRSDADAAERVATEVRALGVEVLPIRADTASAEACDGAVRQVLDAYGRIDVLVVSAGITRDGLAMRMKPEQFDEVLAVNLSGAFYMARAVLTPMVRARWGRIVFLSSVAGLYGNAGQANYAASKAGLIGMAKSLAKEVGSRSITVNVVAPGFIETDMTAGLPDRIREGARERTALQRLGEPREVAAVVSFLASDDASFITGETLCVSGGLVL